MSSIGTDAHERPAGVKRAPQAPPAAAIRRSVAGDAQQVDYRLSKRTCLICPSNRHSLSAPPLFFAASSSLASERQAGEAQEAARLHQLISEGARTHLHAAIAAATAEGNNMHYVCVYVRLYVYIKHLIALTTAAAVTERREQTHEGLQGTHS